MNIDTYQKKAMKTARYPAIGGMRWLYPLLGLGEEAGEVLGHVAKAIRDNKGKINKNVRLAAAKEMGDLLWMLSAASHEFGFTLSEIAQMNLNKLADRQKRGVLGGSGDNR